MLKIQAGSYHTPYIRDASNKWTKHNQGLRRYETVTRAIIPYEIEIFPIAIFIYEFIWNFSRLWTLYSSVTASKRAIEKFPRKRYPNMNPKHIPSFQIFKWVQNNLENLTYHEYTTNKYG